jgi:hypothetical protein
MNEDVCYRFVEDHINTVILQIKTPVPNNFSYKITFTEGVTYREEVYYNRFQLFLNRIFNITKLTF